MSRHNSSRWCVAGVLGLVACAGPQVVMPKVSAEEAFAHQEPTPLPRVPLQMVRGSVWAHQFRRPIDCALAAREAGEVDRAEGWRRVQACVARGSFSLLPMLVDGWAEELRSQPEAGPVLARVLAARGARLETDVQLLNEQRIPVFGLEAALQQPSTYRGHYVVVAGKVERVRQVDGRVEAVLSELTPRTEMERVLVPSPVPGSASQQTTRAEADGAWGAGALVMPARGRGTLSAQARQEPGTTELRYHDSFAETGKELVVRLASPDPFLGADRPFVFVLRFEGALASDDVVPDDQAEVPPSQLTSVATLVSYAGLNAPYAY